MLVSNYCFSVTQCRPREISHSVRFVDPFSRCAARLLRYMCKAVQLGLCTLLLLETLFAQFLRRRCVQLPFRKPAIVSLLFGLKGLFRELVLAYVHSTGRLYTASPIRSRLFR